MEPVRTVTNAAYDRAQKMNVFINLGSKSGVLKPSAAPKRWKRFPDTVYYVPLRVAGPRGMVQTFIQRQLTGVGYGASEAQALAAQNLNDPNQTITAQNYTTSAQYASLSQIVSPKSENPWKLTHVFGLVNNLDRASFVKRAPTKKGGVTTYVTVAQVMTVKKAKGASSPGRRGKRGPKKTLAEKIKFVLETNPVNKKTGKQKVIRVDKLDENGGNYHTVDKTDKEETNWYHLRELRLSAKTKEQLIRALNVSGYTDYIARVQSMPDQLTGGMAAQQVLSPMRGGAQMTQSPVRTSLPAPTIPQQQPPLVLPGTITPVPQPGSRRSGTAQPTSPRSGSSAAPPTGIPGMANLGAFQ